MFPAGATDGLYACVPVPGTGCGLPPETGIRQSEGFPARVAENTISRPSGIQLSPYIGPASEVRRLASPPLTGTMNRSLTTPARVPRIKATVLPSGEKTAPLSRTSAGGRVSLRVLRSPSERRVIQDCGLSELASGKASHLPSGDQSRPG